jgi:hypothetical protein
LKFRIGFRSKVKRQRLKGKGQKAKVKRQRLKGKGDELSLPKLQKAKVKRQRLKVKRQRSLANNICASFQFFKIIPALSILPCFLELASMALTLSVDLCTLHFAF